MKEYDDYLKWKIENTTSIIYTYDELYSYIDRNGVITTPLEIRGLHITKLSGVRKTNYHFSLGDTEIEDLGELEVVEGNLSIWNIRNVLKIHSLQNIKIVNGDVNLRYSKLKSLGSLEHIGGNLNLRDTDITDLGTVKTICGNLHLPKKYQSVINISHINIGGKVKYWNVTKHVIPIQSPNKKLVKSEIPIPHWKFRYILSYEEVKYENNEIQLFYDYFKTSFFNGKYLDVRGESNYLFTLLLELRDTLTKNEHYQVKKGYFKTLSECYPVLRTYTTDWIIELVEFNTDYVYLKELLLSKYEDDFYDFELVRYFYILEITNDDTINSNLIWRVIPTSSITSYGKDNLTDVKFYFDKRVSESRTSNTINEFRNYVKRWKSYNSISIDESVEKELKKIITFYERELRESENDLRLSRELPKIGEGWISETELFYFIRNEFSYLNVIHHGKPKWLGRQHLDIYIEEYNIGIEFQGKQHTQSVEYFGGEISFEKQLLLDKKKKYLCKENSCELIEVFPNYDRQEVITVIKEIFNKKGFPSQV